ncbi:MAG TPA: ABC transporter substrate-binding protein [Candidatus Limnocylindria bacterium]|jgi:peptide/nickel transport system substrate-binding protein|nr:ABC transporter substrate-binding protein [Candidatus Limnocylindria bacterium]
MLQGVVTESLVRRDPDGGFVARLATQVPTIANGDARIVTDAATPEGRLVATFVLRDDARWQDGEPITADDVRLAFDDDRAAPLATARRWMADRVARVDRIDDRTIRFTYRAGERWELYPLVARVLPAHVLENASAEKRTQYQREPMHAGPFAVAAWIPGFGMTLSAFPRYVGGAPALGRIEVRFYSDRGAVVDALRRGEVDVAGAPAVEADLARTLDRFADGPRLQALYKAANAIEMLRFGTKGTPFTDLRVRQAVELALDRRGLVDAIFAGRARVPRSYLVPPLWAATEPLDAPRLDREGARALLAAAGFRPGRLGILERGAERMTVTLQVATGSQARIDAGRRLSGDLAAVGIAASVLERAPADVLDAVARGDFDLALVPERTDDPQLASDRYRGVAGSWFDVLLAAAASAPERADKRTLYAELQRSWAESLPGVPLYQELLVDVAPRNLDGIQPSPNGDPLTWNVRDWRFVSAAN